MYVFDNLLRYGPHISKHLREEMKGSRKSKIHLMNIIDRNMISRQQLCRQIGYLLECLGEFRTQDIQSLEGVANSRDSPCQQNEVSVNVKASTHIRERLPRKCDPRSSCRGVVVMGESTNVISGSRREERLGAAN